MSGLEICGRTLGGVREKRRLFCSLVCFASGTSEARSVLFGDPRSSPREQRSDVSGMRAPLCSSVQRWPSLRGGETRVPLVRCVNSFMLYQVLACAVQCSAVGQGEGRGGVRILRRAALGGKTTPLELFVLSPVPLGVFE